MHYNPLFIHTKSKCRSEWTTTPPTPPPHTHSFSFCQKDRSNQGSNPKLLESKNESQEQNTEDERKWSLTKTTKVSGQMQRRTDGSKTPTTIQTQKEKRSSVVQSTALSGLHETKPQEKWWSEMRGMSSNLANRNRKNTQQQKQDTKRKGKWTPQNPKPRPSDLSTNLSQA